jgi:hypothetical protein
MDLSLEYRGGIAKPDATQIGHVAIVGPLSNEGALPQTYARDARPISDGTEQDSFDLFPRVFRVQTLDATPLRITTIPVPLGYETKIDIELTAIDAALAAFRIFQRCRARNFSVPGMIYGGDLIDLEPAIGTLVISGLSVTPISTGIQIFVTGGAFAVEWTARVRRDLFKVRLP